MLHEIDLDRRHYSLTPPYPNYTRSMTTKTPEVFGYAVMAAPKSLFHHNGQYAFFRLKRDAIAWRDKNYPNDERDEDNQIEIRNAILKISLF
jgi:hypothetical protein